MAAEEEKEAAIEVEPEIAGALGGAPTIRSTAELSWTQEEPSQFARLEELWIKETVDASENQAVNLSRVPITVSTSS